MLASSPRCPGCLRLEREIRRLHERIDRLEADNRRLYRRVARLKKDNRRLRRELDEARRQPLRQAGPFRRRKLKKRCKRPGRPKGHLAAARPTPTPEQIDRRVHVPCRVCPDCNTELVDPGQVVQYQTDLPPIVPIVTQFTMETGFCPCCRRRVQGRHPQQISNASGAAGNTLGPVVLTMAAELKHRLGVPYRKICDFFATYYSLNICPATLVRAEQRLARLAKPTYDLLIDALRQCDIVHADETGWRVSAVNAWLWVFSNQDITKHIMNHCEEWLLFLHEPQVPPTNNHAERMLRPAVITRKVGGCNKTLLGALVHSILASLMVTCQQQGRKFLDLAKRLWQEGEPQTVPLKPPAKRAAVPV